MNTIDKLWAYVRGDSNIRILEELVYAQNDLEDIVGGEFILDFLLSEFIDASAPERFRLRLLNILLNLHDGKCKCAMTPSGSVFPMSSESNEWTQLHKIEKYKSPENYLVHCEVCGEAWFVTEDLDDSDYYYFRMSLNQINEIKNNNQWPENLERLGWWNSDVVDYNRLGLINSI